jgi:hypothetical protein
MMMNVGCASAVSLLNLMSQFGAMTGEICRATGSDQGVDCQRQPSTMVGNVQA